MKKLAVNLHLPVWKRIILGAMTIVMASFIMAAPGTDAVDFSGTWLGKTNLPHFGPDEFTLVLKKEKDSCTGMVVVDSLDIVKPDTPIQNIEVEGDVITFTFPLLDRTMLSCHLTLDGEKMNGYWSHSAGARGIIVFENENKKAYAKIKYADFVGDYKFVLEGEEMLIKIYVEDGVLCGVGEYSLGELKPVKGNDLKFKVVTPHGENWSFEFIKDDRGRIVKCKFRDEDFAEMDSVTGVKILDFVNQ
jgi:hypothetical protein